MLCARDKRTELDAAGGGDEQRPAVGHRMDTADNVFGRGRELSPQCLAPARQQEFHAEWLSDVKKARADTFLALTDHLPAEAAEALLELATGGKPRVLEPAGMESPFEHPDAQRRFLVMTNVEELERAFDFPWEKWTVFLHPEQRHWVERDYAGPARVSGSAGTGKTIVALHRPAQLARTHPDSRVLLTTFSDMLANALQTKLKRLVGSEPRLAERIDVHSLDAIGLRFYKTHVGPATIASRKVIRDWCLKVAPRWAATSSDRTFYLPSGSRSSTHGNWRPGRHIAMSLASVERRDYRSRDARCCGRSLSASAQD